VRRALELSIDRDALNQVVFNGEFVPGNQWINPQNPYYQQAYPIPKRDVAKAKALLKEAGVTAPLTLDFMVPNGAETRAVAEVVQSMAAEAGFDLKIRVTEFATSLKQSEDGDYQLFLMAGAAAAPTAIRPSSRPATHRRTRQILRQESTTPAGRLKRSGRRRRPVKGLPDVLTEGSIVYLYTQFWWRFRQSGYKRCRTGWCAWSASS
jgi:peptide/nickel transport system substrate-binding protein